MSIPDHFSLTSVGKVVMTRWQVHVIEVSLNG